MVIVLSMKQDGGFEGENVAVQAEIRHLSPNKIPASLYRAEVAAQAKINVLLKRTRQRCGVMCQYS